MIKQSYQSLNKVELINILQQRDAKIDQLEIKFSTLSFELSNLKRMVFGTKQERYESTTPQPRQKSLFENTGEEITSTEEVIPQKENIAYIRTKKDRKEKPFRKLLPEHLRREVILIEPDKDITGRKKIGSEITETLGYIKGEIYVKRIVRPKYVVAGDESKGVVIGKLPALVFPKSMIDASLLVHLLVSKFIDHLPVYRLIQMFKRDSIEFPQSTVGGWIKAGADLLVPLYEALQKATLQSGYLQVDETPMKVLDKNKQKKIHRGYFWEYFDPIRGLTLFEYSEGRSQETPLGMLRNFIGVLQTDGYSVYEIFAKFKEIILSACMAHARRKFNDALNVEPKLAGHIVEEFQKLYQIEREAREQKLSPKEKVEKRRKEALPILERMEKWLKDNLCTRLPSNPLSKAIQYSLSRWDKLSMYVDYGYVEIDNNLAENNIRPIALGRKNYLFCGSHEAAQRTAMFYSFFSSCKHQNINPAEWMEDVLNRIQDHSIQNLEELLPHKWKPAEIPAPELQISAEVA